MTAELWVPGACFARAKAQVGKLFWHSERERLVVLLEARQLLLDPKNNEEDLFFLWDRADFDGFHSTWSRSLEMTKEEWVLYMLNRMFGSEKRRPGKQHLLDILYVKFLDQKIVEEIFRVEDDPFYTGRLIL